MKGNVVGQEQLLRKNGIPILGELLTKVNNVCLNIMCFYIFLICYRYLQIRLICKC